MSNPGADAGDSREVPCLSLRNTEVTKVMPAGGKEGNKKSDGQQVQREEAEAIKSSKNAAAYSKSNKKNSRTPSVASNNSVKSEQAKAVALYTREVNKLQNRIEEIEEDLVLKKLKMNQANKKISNLEAISDPTDEEYDESQTEDLKKRIRSFKAHLETYQDEYDETKVRANTEIKRITREIDAVIKGHEAVLAEIADNNDDLLLSSDEDDPQDTNQVDENNGLPLGDENGASFDPQNNWGWSHGASGDTPAMIQIGEALRILATNSNMGISNKLATRQVMGKDLPLFSGRPETWPMFISAFETTTANCGFSDAENVERLRTSLRGDAYHTVQGMFASPNALQSIMALLKEKYGQPKSIINAQIKRVRDCPPVKDGNPETMIKFGEAVVNAVSTMKNLGENDYVYSSVLVDEFSQKLPCGVRKSWDKALIEGRRRDNLEEFAKWIELEKRVAYRQYVPKFDESKNDTKKKQSHSSEQKEKMGDTPTAAALLSGQEQKSSCIFCKKSSHQSSNCFKAEAMPWQEKSEIIKASKLCFICFKPNHFAKKCTAKVSCPLCSKRHCRPMCSTLPMNKRENKDVSREDTKKESEPKEKDDDGPPETNFFSSLTCRKDVKMMTVVARIKGLKDNTTVRILFDSGCQISQGGERILKKVGGRILGESVQSYVQLCGPVDTRVQKQYEVSLESLDGKFKKKVILSSRENVCPAEIPRIANGQVIQEIKKRKIWLSDFEFSKVDEPNIEIIIGSDYFGEFMMGSIINLDCGLHAINTKFGWTVTGRAKEAVEYAGFTLSMFNMTGETNLWSLEALGINEPFEHHKRQEREEAAMQHFLETVERKENGGYQVSLPWIEGKEFLPSNFNIAKARLKSTTFKLMKADKFKEYNQVFKDWLAEGIIEQAEPDCDLSHYLPHRAVFKPESLTTPVRPVFDASCRVEKSPSLNQCLERGPNLLELIPSLLNRFRLKKVGAIADIRKAFQMIDIRDEDRNYLKFLWWENDQKKILRGFRHCRVVFGVNCSPFLLAAVLQKHLKSVEGCEKETSKLLSRSLYVDNCIASFDSQAEYLHFKETSTRILAEAAMELRQWESNAEIESENAITNVLGLKWDKQFDILMCDIPSSVPCEKITKRELLSAVQKIFDPQGFLCPAMLPPKLLMQKTWLLKLKWDSALPSELEQVFCKWLEQMHDLKQVRIPRVIVEPGSVDLQLHVFSDASQKAYSAVAFLRSTSGLQVNVSLLQAKARVSPVKSLTIPRLELMGCLIGARLATRVKEDLCLQQLRTFFWTDSSTALAWIKRNGQWGTFVGNRVQEICKLTNQDQWKHIPGDENPADLPSRGCTPRQLLLSRWWEGPSWLRSSEEEWPKTAIKPDEEAILAEKMKSSSASMLTPAVDKPWYDFKFSSFQKCVRVLAWVRRFVLKFFKLSQHTGKLTVEETNAAEQKLFKLVQSDSFNTNSSVIEGVRVIKMDELIRVKTKLLYRQDTMSFKLPVLMPNSNHIVDKMIREEHLLNCHAGAQILMGLLREKVWILQGRRAIRRIISSCVPCKRYVVKPACVETASLPENRIKDAKVFEVVGIDMAGPLYLSDGSKSWFIIFTCAVYRAIHLELVNSASTDVFILALIRFVKRRGRPAIIYTDNGSNFQGTVNYFKNLGWDRIKKDARISKIQWIFNPPAAPWWGGFWERLIRSIKDLLKRMLGCHKLSYVEMETMLCEVEYAVNSRPLTFVTEDQNDLIPLTPSMFLNELPTADLPESVALADPDLKGKYKQLLVLRQELKTRFRKEYLGLLIQRGNERKLTAELKVGDIVLMGTEKQKRVLWPMGRIVEVFPGKDNKVRVVKVKTSSSTFLRPVQKIYPLEISSTEDLPEQFLPVSESLSSDDDLPQPVPEQQVKTRCGRVTKKNPKFKDYI